MSAPVAKMVTAAALAGGSGIAILMTVIFAILKVTHTIAWSWLWVLSPLVFSVGVYVLFLVAFGFFAIALAKDFE